jgi:anti-sigma B factor antagonist
MVNKMKFEVIDDGSKITLKVDGDIESSTLGEIRERVNALSLSADKDIVVDMKNVDYIDSSGIGMLIKLHKEQKNKGQKVKVINTNSRVSEILSLSSLSEALTK